MAESPGKLLSSVCLGGDDRDQSSRSSSGGSSQSSSCVNLFIHLFDWNRRLSKKGLLFGTKRLLAAEESGRRRRKNGRKMKMDERLPMAKLLLIADENRRNCGQIQQQQQQQPKPSPVARLMGLEQSAPTSAEIRSLQELLHLDQEDSPKMLQEFLHKQQQEQQQKQQRQDANRQQEALLNLLIQEVSSSSSSAKNPQRSVLGFPERPPRIAKSSSSSSKSHRAASAATVGIASSGCGGFSKRPSGLFLEAAAKILDPRNPPSRHGARSLPRGAFRNRASEDEFATARVLEAGSISRGSDMFSARRNDCVASAPCSPVSDHGRNNNNNKNTREISSCTSIRSLMELFLDDLEEDMTNPSTSSRSSSSSRTRKTVSEPCSPIASREERREFRTVNLAPSGHSPSSSTSSGVLGKMVCVDELEEHDYISFRNFLTGGGRNQAKASSNIKVDKDDHDHHQHQEEEEEVSCAEEEDDDEEAASSAAVHHEEFKFMVHNPLFDDNSQNYSDNASSFFSDNEQDDQGLEEILKSILYQSGTSGGDGGEAKDLSRLTWLPDSSNNSSLSSRENYLFNKDSSSEADDSSPQMDNDSVELTSESNCGEDCGQPSPVSVLDSPFDDDLTRKGGKSSRSSGIRKRLDFADESLASTSTSSSCIARLQRFTLNTLEEAEEYVMMILEESGIRYHADATLMVPDKLTSSSEEKKINGGVVSSSVFERLEDRVRVQQLIEHLEACGSTSRADQRADHHSLESLRAHYESYHECRSRRRMIFDFVNEVLNVIVDEIHGGSGERGGVGRVHVVTGKEVVEEARKQVMGWKREEFESIHELVDKEIEKSSSRVWREFDADVCEIGECCEQLIWRGMVEELARDLLA